MGNKVLKGLAMAAAVIFAAWASAQAPHPERVYGHRRHTDVGFLLHAWTEQRQVEKNRSALQLGVAGIWKLYVRTLVHRARRETERRGGHVPPPVRCPQGVERTAGEDFLRRRDD